MGGLRRPFIQDLSVKVIEEKHFNPVSEATSKPERREAVLMARLSNHLKIVDFILNPDRFSLIPLSAQAL